MSLRKKTLIVIGLTFLVLAVAVYFTLQATVIRRFNEYEEEEVLRDVDRAGNALSAEISYLDDFLQDWSNWDDAYSYVQTGNEAFVATNLGNEAFRVYDLNLVAFVDLSGRVVYQKSFDSILDQAAPVPREVSEHLVPGDPLLTYDSEADGVSGLLLTSEDPMMVVSRPILTSDVKGPQIGSLVMGRYLDPPTVRKLARTTRLGLELIPVDAAVKPDDVTRALDTMSEGKQRITETLASGLIAGYTIVPDVYGNPAVVLRVTEERTIHRQGQAFALYLSLALFVVFFVSGGVLMALMERVVVSPVSRLDSSVSEIGAAADPSVRVDVRGHDELSSLGGSINKMLEALERSHAELKAMNAELDGYAHIVSHDLKSPLTAMMSATDLLDRLLLRGDDARPMSPYVNDALNVLHKGIEKSSALITDLLDLAEAGQKPGDVEPVSVNDVVTSIVGQMKPVLEQRNAKIVTDEDLGSVTASPTHIYQLFSNLISNAIKHNDKQGPVVRVSSLGEDAGGGHRYVVSDNGPGIPEADMDKLFIPFFKGSGGETGVGLSIVEKVIRNYSGEIQVYNRGGANFEFVLRDIEG